MNPQQAIEFLEEIARYLDNLSGEDHWVNVRSAQNCRKIAAMIGEQPKEK